MPQVVAPITQLSGEAALDAGESFRITASVAASGYTSSSTAQYTLTATRLGIAGVSAIGTTAGLTVTWTPPAGATGAVYYYRLTQTLASGGTQVIAQGSGSGGSVAGSFQGSPQAGDKVQVLVRVAASGKTASRRAEYEVQITGVQPSNDLDLSVVFVA